MIVTLDSDLLLYGPQKVLLRFDAYTSSGYLVTFDGIFQKLFCNSNEISLRKAAILSGCDYVKNLKGVGLIAAQKTVSQQQNIILCCQALLSRGKENPYKTDNNYVFNVVKALFAFNYQVVYDVFNQKEAYLSQMEGDTVLYPIFSEALGNMQDSITRVAPSE